MNCVKLKIIKFLLGQQSDCTKLQWFLCLSDSRARDQQWNIRELPAREDMKVVEKNVIIDPLDDKK